jgi:Tfp pilus assembly protein PilN
VNTLFQVNFRREAFRRERAEARRRAAGLGVWLTYFGVLAVVLGLYGLNWSELGSRTQQLERQIAAQRELSAAGADWTPPPADAGLAEAWVSDVTRWRDLLARLPQLLPEGVRLTSVRFNPDGIGGGERKLLLSGVLRVDGRLDRMTGVTDLVATVARDSLFAAHFKSVRLVSTRSRDDLPDAQFELECR